MIYKLYLYILIMQWIIWLAGGNQREKAREKAQKKQKEVEKKKDTAGKGINKGKTLEERRERYTCCLAAGQAVQSLNSLINCYELIKL